jgi:putative MATE family efflux protein
MVLHYTLFLFKKHTRKFRCYDIKFIFPNLIQQIKLGYPISISEVVLMIGFSVFYKIIGIIGTIELATSHVILNIAHASFMPAIGVGMACATLIGKFLGEKTPDKTDKVVKEGIKWSLLIMGSMGFLFIFAPHWIVPIFSTDPEIIRMGVPCLRIIGVLQYFDAVGITLFFVLTGAGNTRFPAIADMVIVWLVFLPVSYYLGIVLKMGVVGAWLGFAAWIIPLSVVMALKVRTGTWKQIKV